MVGEDPPEIWRVLIDLLVEPDDDAVLDEPRGSAGRVAEPVVFDDVRVLPRRREEVELLRLLVERRMLELEVDARPLLQLLVRRDLPEGLHRRADVRAHRAPVAQRQRLRDDGEREGLRARGRRSAARGRRGRRRRACGERRRAGTRADELQEFPTVDLLRHLARPPRQAATVFHPIDAEAGG